MPREDRHRILWVGAIAVFVGLGAGSVYAASAQTGFEGDEQRPVIGGLPSDSNGDGLLSDTGNERIPELIAAVGDNGVLGYIRFEDLEGPSAPSDPQEALELTPRVIPLYADDGVSVVGHLSSAGGDVITIVEEPPSDSSSSE